MTDDTSEEQDLDEDSDEDDNYAVSARTLTTFP